MANNFNETIGSMFKGLDTLMNTKTVVGEPVYVGNTIIVPLVDVNFGIAAGAFAKSGSKHSSAGGMGGKMSPTAVLVITDGKAKMVSVKAEDTISKIIDMVPEVVDKVASIRGKKTEHQLEVEEKIEEIGQKEEIIDGKTGE